MPAASKPDPCRWICLPGEAPSLWRSGGMKAETRKCVMGFAALIPTAPCKRVFPGKILETGFFGQRLGTRPMRHAIGTLQRHGSRHRLGTWGPLCVLWGLLFLPWGAGAAPPSPNGASDIPKTQSLPKIVVESPQADLGEVMENGTISHDFVVRNEGNAPLTIEQVRPG